MFNFLHATLKTANFAVGLDASPPRAGLCVGIVPPPFRPRRETAVWAMA